ncbi:MAG: endonuclease/exonuclease/phosphatase family protein [Pseudomonas sp.]|jgi:endonuclease/exonuclease/phosphatase family metal-dependent hydrolase|nr:endonuclease/exonuclease/phosphatase family protein [Pseudomonas sp.]MDY0414209.1 endonuclease/exonuclease/phosphatase family protein [Pseudomonas sp.]NLO54251.1 endonuclease/exonuclease/phosphatase family protein [Gammaproteobacteria bacterium]
MLFSRYLSRHCQTLAFTLLTLFGSLGSIGYAYASDIIFASWNIQNLGHGDHKKYTGLAAIAGKADLLAIQEVMTTQGLVLLERAVEKQTGEQWSSLISHPVGSKKYKEMYAFLWRDSAIEPVRGHKLYPDNGNRFIREPFSAKFKSKHDNSEFAVGTVHILYGQGAQDRTPEIKALADYWRWMQSTYPGTALVLAGDFNMPPSHDAWSALKKYAKPLITEGASTLSEKNGQYANLYDNIWVERNTTLKITQAGIISFPKMLKLSHKDSRKYMSDHAPVYMTLGHAELDKSVVTVVEPEPNLGLPPGAQEALEQLSSMLAPLQDKINQVSPIQFSIKEILAIISLAFMTFFTAKKKSRRQKFMAVLKTLQKNMRK